MSFELTLRRVVAGLAVVTGVTSVITASVLWLGGHLVSPASALQAEVHIRAHSDSMMQQTDTLILRELTAHEEANRAFRDSIGVILRPLRINLCVRSSEYDQLLMNLDCGTVLRVARDQVLLRKRSPP